MNPRYALLFNTALGGDTGGDAGGGTATTTTTETPAPVTIEWPKNWKEALPEDIRGEDALKVVHDIPTLAKSFVHAQKAVGKNKIIVPDQHATEDDWKQVFSKLGLPEDVKQYDIKVPEVFKDEEFLNSFKATAHKAGILPKQAEGLLTWYAELAQAQEQAANEAAEAEVQTALADYKKTLGAGYDRHVALANKAINEVAGVEFAKYLRDSGLGNDVNLIKAFAAIGKKLYGEDAIPGEGQGSGLTPEEAKSRWEQISGDRNHPYWNPEHPKNAEAKKEVADLFVYMHGNKPVA